jgi:hypothetical protein
LMYSSERCGKSTCNRATLAGTAQRVRPGERLSYLGRGPGTRTRQLWETWRMCSGLRNASLCSMVQFLDHTCRASVRMLPQPGALHGAKLVTDRRNTGPRWPWTLSSEAGPRRLVEIPRTLSLLRRSTERARPLLHLGRMVHRHGDGYLVTTLS